MTHQIDVTNTMKMFVNMVSDFVLNIVIKGILKGNLLDLETQGRSKQNRDETENHQFIHHNMNNILHYEVN